MSVRRKVRWAFRVVFLIALLPASYLFVRWWGGNVGEFVPGRVYRSAQLTPGQLKSLIARHGIKTVVNLRGPNPNARWYRDERAASLDSGATQVDLPLASDMWLSRAQARALLDVLDGAEAPFLIHCQWGAERTGLASAFVTLLRPGGSVAEAERCFSVRYLFLPTRDGRMMAGHLAAYKTWLAVLGREHSPQRFRHWLRDVYVPGRASSESWPYDPNPLVVVTRPADAMTPMATRERASIR
jgi:protein tyrosine phosphatase (PTP) superfamily phosphohydrolase (DUF442 family)